MSKYKQKPYKKITVLLDESRPNCKLYIKPLSTALSKYQAMGGVVAQGAVTDPVMNEPFYLCKQATLENN